MKKVADRVVYDTEKAEELASASYGYGTDFYGWYETLYKTAKDRYFIAGKGGPMSHYAVNTGNGTSGGEHIRPLTIKEALDWCETNGIDVRVMKAIDPDALEEA